MSSKWEEKLSTSCSIDSETLKLAHEELSESCYGDSRLAREVIEELTMKCSLTKDELMFKEGVEQKWAYMAYHGEWFHPLRKALDAFVAETQKMVSGTVKVELYKGNADITYRNSSTSLFSPEIRSIKSSGFSQPMCADAAKIRGLLYEILAKREQTIKG